MRKSTKSSKDPAAVSLGKRGGKARMAALTREQKRALGQLAASKRWGKRRKSDR